MIPRFLPALLVLMIWTLTSKAQPDYAAAHWAPPACSKWYSTGNTRSFCVIHDMEGYYQDSISYLNRCDLNTNGNYNVSASVYYLVNGLQNGSDTHGHRENNSGDSAIGDITQSIRESNWAWHVSCWNTYMFGTEHEGFVNDPAWYTLGMYQASAGLQRHLCDKYGIIKDRNHIVAHGEWQNSAWTSWMATNYPAIDTTCNNHTDPGIYWNWTYFMSLLNSDPTVTGNYWDVNGATAGSGATPNGTWGLSVSNWSSSATGAATPGRWVQMADAIFCAGTDAINPYTVTVSGTQTVYSVQVLSGNPTFNGGGLNFTGTGQFYTNYVGAGRTATFNTTFTGGGAPDKWGPGTAIYNSAAIVTGTSYMTINEGTIAVGNDAAFGPNKFYIGDPAGVNIVTLKSANSTAHTLANNLLIYAASFILDAGGDLTFSGPVDLRTTVHTVTVNNNNSSFSGTLTNAGGITKAGPGTLIYSGAAANTYGGATTVSGGTLKLNKTTGVNAVAGASLTVNSGGVLLLAAANQIADAVPMTLAGGMFNTAGLSENLGTLKVTGNSAIDLASGASVLKFAASGGVAWTAGTTLTVNNWNGSVNGGGGDQLFFGTTGSGLSSGQLAQVKFVNPPGFDPGTYAAKILGSGEAVPLAVAPSVTTQPQSQNVLVGTNVIFTVALSGTTPMAFQWRWGGTNMANATNNNLSLTNISAGQSGSYSVVVTNIGGATTSSTAVLAVYATAAPAFSTPASSADGQFSFGVSGVPGWRYIVQGSSNLFDWIPVETNVAPFTFTDTNVLNNSSEFYRAVYAP